MMLLGQVKVAAIVDDFDRQAPARHSNSDRIADASDVTVGVRRGPCKACDELVSERLRHDSDMAELVTKKSPAPGTVGQLVDRDSPRLGGVRGLRQE